MGKEQAVAQLEELFGHTNIVGTAHSVMVELSRYVLIFLFVSYTWHCFTVLIGSDQKRKERVYLRQRWMIFAIHGIGSLILLLNSLSYKFVILYIAQLVILLFMSKAYPYVYPDMSKLVLNNMLMLLSIGFVMIERLDGTSAWRQMIFVAVTGILYLFIPYIIDKFPYFNRFGWIYAGLGIVLLSLVFVIGRERGGARNWIVIGSFALQPSEFVKITFVFFAAALLAKAADFYSVVKVSIVAAIHVLILVAEKDLGGALLFFLTYIVILYVATQRAAYLLAGLAGGSVAAAVAYHFFTHVQNRVIAWRDPWTHITQSGWQVAQSLFAIGTGGWFGMGLGEGMPRKIPVASTDFIFSAIAEEMGVFFAVCLLLVELSSFLLFVNIALKMRRRFYKLTALGLAAIFAFQVFLTVGGAIKFVPSTGVTLPLVSYGGSSVISTMILFGIIQGMYVLNQEEVRELEEQRETQREEE